ncbi:putative PEP-binding protein [Pseudonocardia pini]|uniref:putative PEP-binding protein n=1 Tax=Pseudonocardia pini TaxID=2758030 RepID=UPI0015F0493F|nr:putative PEP-binding protein [Pseudonocardia pini]
MSAAVNAGTGYRWLVVPDDPAVEPSRDLVGGKAWSLWRMRSLGLRVPPAFVVTTEACAAYFSGDGLPEGLVDELAAGIRLLEQQLGRTFGGTERPLLVSVRSGAAISMPGMMDTILDLGCTDSVEQALAAETGDPAFAAEVHRRFTGFYGKLVLGCTEELEELPDLAAVRETVLDDTGETVPGDPWAQLHGAVASVFASSRSRRAVAYRRHYGIPDDLGTAVTVQAMVFGNLDEDSGTGVLFTRNPVNGTREPYGEYLQQGQGEDVVSGRVTPKPLTHLAERAPHVHAELLRAADCLDREGRDAQDIEFTVQHGELFLLRTLDVGGDKPLRYLPTGPEANPFLGVRGLRLTLRNPDLLHDQLRAVVRTARHTPVSVMFPMVTVPAELHAARRALDRALDEEGPADLEVGIMIEVPAAALTADRFAPDVDFFSVGTNDLTQYVTAAERGSPRLTELADPLHPAVLGLIGRTCETGVPTAVCGELAADPRATGLLLALGVRELSVSPPAVARVKQAVREATTEGDLRNRALAAPDAAAVRALLSDG